MTPAIKLLNEQRTRYKLHEYAHNPAAESYGEEACELLEIAPQQTFKTLVVEDGNGNLAVGIVPVAARLSLKAIAKAIGSKKVTMADPAKVERVTGYVLGGVSPLGQKKRLTTVIDASALEFETIFVSGGQRGLEIELSPSDIRNLLDAEIDSIAD